MYIKDFDTWNERKKKTDRKILSSSVFYHEREVWWCAIGMNIGSEMDGKNAYFERPVLVVRHINKEQFFGVPLTSKDKKGKYFISVEYGEGNGSVCLSQFKTLSTKRMLRKIGMVNKKDFYNVKNRFIDFLNDKENED